MVAGRGTFNFLDKIEAENTFFDLGGIDYMGNGLLKPSYSNKVAKFVTNFFLVTHVTHSFSAPLVQKDLIIRNAMIVDVTGKQSNRKASIKISNGVIKKIDDVIINDGSREIDIEGAWVLPGLIDAHVHLRSVPGSFFRNDNEKTYWELFDQHLKAYLAAGVTTILDAAAPEDLIKRLKSYEANKKAMPRVLFLAPFLTPENGYFSSEKMRSQRYSKLWPVIKTRNDIDQALEQVTQYHPTGIKLTLESGFGPFNVWKIFDENMRDYISQQSTVRKFPLFIHSMNEKMHKIALSMKPRALMHAGFSNTQPSDSFLEELKKSGVSVVSTLSIEDSTLIKWDKHRLDIKTVKELTPTIELETARDDKAWDFAFQTTTDISTPAWIPQFLSRIFGGFFISENIIKNRLSSSQLAVRKMFKAGVPIVMGTDSGCWPILPQIFHGSTSLRELELLVDSGLTPFSAIQTATINAARMLQVDNLIGTVDEGKRADLIILDDDPLQDIHNLRKTKWVVKEGIIYSPETWLNAENIP